MIRQLGQITLLAAALLGFGCNLQQPGTVLVKYEGDGLARLSEAPGRGRYALFSKNSQNPDVTYPLNKGDALGFSKADGKVDAVAGTHHDEIKDGTTYFWRMLED